MTEPQFPDVEIGSVLEKVTRPVEVDPTATYQEIGIRSHGKGLFDKEPITGSALGDKRVFWIEPNCFILNIVFAWERAVGKTTDADAGKIASHRFPMFRPIEGKADLEYITYFFKTEYGRELLSLASPGGAGRNKTLGQNEFLRLRVRLPPYDEQRRIGAILLAWDHAIETVEALMANSRERKSALLQDLLTGRRRLATFDDEWSEIELEKVARVVMGASPPSHAYNFEGAGLPLIQGNADVEGRTSAPRMCTREVTQECDLGDILFSVRAPVGEVAISAHHACIGRGMAAVRPKKPQDVEFLYFALMRLEPTWARISQGSTFQAITGADLKRSRIPWPKSSKERVAIGKALATAQAIEDGFSSKLATLRREKSALMQQLLTGKRRLATVEGEAA